MGDDEPGLRVDGNIKLLQQLGFQSCRSSEVKDVGLRSESVGTVRCVERIRCVPFFGVTICGEAGSLSKIIDGILKIQELAANESLRRRYSKEYEDLLNKYAID